MASTYNGINSSERWENLRRHKDRGDESVGKTERLVSGIAGAALVVLSLRKRRLRPILLPVATGLIARALTGRGPTSRALGGLTRRQGSLHHLPCHWNSVVSTARQFSIKFF